MSAEYLIPVLDESFDRLAAQEMRRWLELYEIAPDVIKSALENVAIAQDLGKQKPAPPAKPAPQPPPVKWVPPSK